MSYPRFCPFRVLTAFLTLLIPFFIVTTIHSDAFTESLPPLFTVSLSTPTDPPSEPTIVRSRFVTVDFDLLGDDGSPASALYLNLFEDADFTALLDHAESNSSDTYTWVGRLDGIEHGQAVMVVTNGLLAGSISMPGRNYEVRPLGGDQHAILEIDQSLFPPELEPEVVVTPPQNSQIVEGDAGVTYSLSLATQPAQPVAIYVIADEQCTVEPNRLIFDTANWGTVQTVTVQATDDALNESDHPHRSVIMHAVVSDDEQYQHLVVDSVELVIIDNDNVGVDISALIYLPFIPSP